MQVFSKPKMPTPQAVVEAPAPPAITPVDTQAASDVAKEQRKVVTGGREDNIVGGFGSVAPGAETILRKKLFGE